MHWDNQSKMNSKDETEASAMEESASQPRSTTEDSPNKRKRRSSGLEEEAQTKKEPRSVSKEPVLESDDGKESSKGSYLVSRL